MTAKYRYGKEFRMRQESEGVPDPSVSAIVEGYREWVGVEEFSVIRNTDTGEYLPCAVSKLGNVKYAINKRAQLQPVIDAFDGMVLDLPIPGGRDKRHRMGYALLITLTYDHKLYSAVEAYRRCGEDINRFKAHFTKLIDSPYVSMAVKEGTKSGYPAPHLIFIVCRPMPVFLHKDKWRVQDKGLYRAIHEAWYQASGGSYNCDIEAIVGNTVKGTGPRQRGAMSYVLKYITKASDADAQDTESQHLADVTHAMMKYTGCRDIIGKKFLAMLGLVDDSSLPLDLIQKKNELKRLQQRKEELTEMESRFKGAFGWLASPQYGELCRIDREIARVKAEIRAMSPPSPWIYVSTRTFPKSERGQIQTWLESFSQANATIRAGNAQVARFDDEGFIEAMLE